MLSLCRRARSLARIKVSAFGAGDLKRPDIQGSNPCGPANFFYGNAGILLRYLFHRYAAA